MTPMEPPEAPRSEQLESDIIEGERLLLQFAELGVLLREALLKAVEASGGDPELVSNISLRLLLRLELNGTMRPSEIQELTGLSSGGVTKMLDRLEAGGLIERRYDVPEDGRGVTVYITAEGHRLVRSSGMSLEAWVPDVQRVVKDISRVISQD